ncbi:DUF676 domain-containing protein, partial [Haematococcus lacustris]
SGDASSDTAAAGGVEAGWSWRSKAFQIKYCQEEQELDAAPCFQLVSVLPKLNLFLSICGPHLGQLYSGNSLLQIGAGFITAFTKGKCLSELSLSDATSLRSTSLYRLTLGGQDKGSALQRFRSVVLVASQQ